MGSGYLQNPSGACVLRRKLHGELLAPFLPAPIEHIASPTRGHAFAKAMRPNATLITGSVGGLAHENSNMQYKEKSVNAER